MEVPAYHVIHKLPPGASPYVRAKPVEKKPEGAIAWFCKAINAADRIESALKDMAVVMKQQERADEAIEAQEPRLSLTYTRNEEQIELLKQKLGMIYQGEAFNGKSTRTARSRGRKFQVTVKQETSRILGNLGWAYMQQGNYLAAAVVYRKAQIVDPDANKACNLCTCLIKQQNLSEARSVLADVLDGNLSGSNDPKAKDRANDLLNEIVKLQATSLASTVSGLSLEDAFIEGLDQLMSQNTPFRSRRLPIFEEISTLGIKWLVEI